jgi:hypothetical protein
MKSNIAIPLLFLISIALIQIPIEISKSNPDDVPSLKDIRRAIYWAQHFLNNLYQEFNWSDSIYGVLKDHPATPLSLNLSAKPLDPYLYRDDTNRTYLVAGLGVLYPNIYGGWSWGSDVDISVINQTGDYFEANYTFQYWGMDIDLSAIYHWNLCKVNLKYYPNDNTQMRIEVKPYWWTSEFPNISGDLYLGSIKIFTNVSSHLGETFTTTTFNSFPANVYTTRRDSTRYALYCWYDNPIYRNRATKIKSLLDAYGFNLNYSDRAYLYRLTDNLSTNFSLATMEYFHDTQVWDSLPKGIGFTPYRSKASFQTSSWSIPYMQYNHPELAVVHWLNKGIGVNENVLLGMVGYPYEDIPIYASAFEIALGDSGYDCVDFNYFGKSSGHRDSLKQEFDPRTGFSSSNDNFSVNGDALALWSILGYQYNYSEARELADELVNLILKAQWGYPFNYGQEGYHYTKDYGRINRPDLTGAFLMDGAIINVPNCSDVYAANGNNVATTWKDAFFLWLKNWFGVSGSPPETGVYIPSASEYTLDILIGLRVYEYFRRKGEIGVPLKAFRALEDINLNGIIDITDVRLVSSIYGVSYPDPSYDERCDLNGDGVIDMIDLRRVSALFGLEDTPIYN